MRMKLSQIGSCLLIVGACACDGSDMSLSDDRLGESARARVRRILVIPDSFPVPEIPDDNPITAAKIELGQHLFYDTKLSGNGTQSCASCHQQDRAFSDGLTRSIGSMGDAHPRNALSLANVAYNATLTWANPVLRTLEDQILIPLFGDVPTEMGAGGRKDAILESVRTSEVYKPLFAKAFDPQLIPSDNAAINGIISWDNIIKALASFVRSIISADSAFDRFVYQNDNDALSDSAMRGMTLFFSEQLECHHCHGGFNFTESSVHEQSVFDSLRFHNTGLYNTDGKGAYPLDNTGVFSVTGDPDDMGRFRPPTLRNVALTAPYMHDGSIDTLDAVVRFYEAGGRQVKSGPYVGDGRASPLKSGFIAGFSLSDSERVDLVEFLKSLSDQTLVSNPQLADPWMQ